jgi:hypothetical protein
MGCMEKQALKLKEHPLLIIVISICLIVSILSPLVSYFSFENILASKNQSYNLNISSAQEENENLKKEISNLTQQLGISENPLMSKPFLVTKLGWYLHNSSDAKVNMANTFTIYGNILNVGATDAQNCSLIIRFYNNEKMLQTSTISIGPISHWSDKDLGLRNIPCSVANSVSRIDIDVPYDTIQ